MIILLSYLYDLSDVGTEEVVKESLSFMSFCGFRFEDQISYHTTLCRFRNKIVAKKAYDRLLKKINEALEKNQTIVKTGVIVDSSITVSPFTPKGGTYLRSGGSEGRGGKQISQRKARAKRDSTRNRYSRKMAQEIR
ncbi:MAG: transposase [Flavobacteriales bacterium Tduv]